MNHLNHIAIIMDGNGRWGLKKNKTRNFGHTKGVNVVQRIIKASIKKKIKFLTLYTFSTENWKRPLQEINFLMDLMSNFLEKNINKLVKNNIKIKIIGNINKIPPKLKRKLVLIQKKTQNNNLIQINVALNYGFKDEIIRSFKLIKKKTLDINEKNIERNFYTKSIPDPQILIRTGGTNRLSNFLLWQLAYSEIFFIKKLWPDFNEKDFYRIINKYKRISRNFGSIQ